MFVIVGSAFMHNEIKGMTLKMCDRLCNYTSLYRTAVKWFHPRQAHWKDSFAFLIFSITSCCG